MSICKSAVQQPNLFFFPLLAPNTAFVSAYLLRDCRLEDEDDAGGIPGPVEAAAALDVGLPRGGGAADLKTEIERENLIPSLTSHYNFGIYRVPPRKLNNSKKARMNKQAENKSNLVK